jgi:hypothetical protein
MDNVMQRLTQSRNQILNRSLRGLWIVLFFVIAGPAFAATFTASLDRTSIVMGDQVVLTLNFEGAKPDEIANPAFDGVQTVSGVSSQTSIVSTPSGQSIDYVYTLQLAPTRTGDIVIPAISAKVNGKIVTSQPIHLKVAAVDPATTPPADYADKQVFLWIVLPKTNLYLNEPMVAELRIYVRSDVRRADSAQQIMPEGNGLTFSQLVAGQHYTRRVGNATFSVIPISVAITPVKTGKVSISPINGSIVLNNLDPLERMWGDAANAVRAPLTSPELDLQVSPLPTEGAPPGFNGSVGSYTMSVTAGPTNLVAGDPITLHVQISGHGSLDSVSFPEQTNWDNFKIYPPTAKVNANDQLGLDGSKTFEEIVTPQNSDIKSLPAISFSFFNPEEKKYHTLNYAATPLTVRAATPGAMPAATAAHPETPQPTADVAPLKQHLGALVQIRPPLVQQPWFLMLQGVPVFALMSCVALRKHKENLANNPRLRRQRQVAQIVREGLQQLQRLAAEKNSDEFFATLFRLLQEQLGERLDLPASAITEAVLDERLRPRGVNSELLASLHELFQTCNLARYAPIKSSQELAAIIPKLESVLNQLRELKA